uniref:Uncharacterized protein n=1 Tax=Aegilops tauschii TaxID=37682 RepID=M8BRZ0_AEGTA
MATSRTDLSFQGRERRPKGKNQIGPMTGSICPRAPAEANNPQGVVQSIGCLQCAVIKVNDVAGFPLADSSSTGRAAVVWLLSIALQFCSRQFDLMLGQPQTVASSTKGMPSTESARTTMISGGCPSSRIIEVAPSLFLWSSCNYMFGSVLCLLSLGSTLGKSTFQFESTSGCPEVSSLPGLFIKGPSATYALLDNES